MKTMKSWTAVVAGAIALGVMAGSAAAALECPVQPIAAGTAQARDISAVIPAGDALDDVAKLNTAVTALRQQGVSQAVIIDNLIAAYCPTVARNASLNEQQKAAKVRRFASQMVRTVYGLGSAEQVILDVPFSPGVADAINSKARSEGIAPETWVANAIDAYLKTGR